METIIKTGEPRPERDFLAGEIDATQKAILRQDPLPSKTGMRTAALQLRAFWGWRSV